MIYKAAKEMHRRGMVLNKKWHVTLNGERLEDCYMCDPSKGWAEIYVKDNDGKFAYDDNGVLGERVKGKIRLAKAK